MQKHLTLVASMHIGLSILGLLIAGLIFFIMIGTGVVAHDDEAFLVLSIVGTVLLVLTVITSIPAIIGAIGLLKHKNWGRILIMVVSAIDLLNIPIGTALGAYSLYVLLQDETVALFQADKNLKKA